MEIYIVETKEKEELIESYTFLNDCFTDEWQLWYFSDYPWNGSKGEKIEFIKSKLEVSGRVEVFEGDIVEFSTVYHADKNAQKKGIDLECFFGLWMGKDECSGDQSLTFKCDSFKIVE